MKVEKKSKSKCKGDSTGQETSTGWFATWFFSYDLLCGGGGGPRYVLVDPIEKDFNLLTVYFHGAFAGGNQNHT